jgi:carbonic anhydrase
MRSLPMLVEGYRRFLDTRYKGQSELYEKLADSGQSPKIMIVACCDSRVDPAAIFDTAPGELFVVRNVANLVPPYAPHGDYHGTSAALEFAVTGLEVDHILVMGHAQCGGVEAFLQGVFDPTRESDFIRKWMSIMNPARAQALRQAPDRDPAKLQREMEYAAVRQSLENLTTFPFVKERLERKVLQLHGAYFGIASGDLLALDPDTGEFEKVA